MAVIMAWDGERLEGISLYLTFGRPTASPVDSRRGNPCRWKVGATRDVGAYDKAVANARLLHLDFDEQLCGSDVLLDLEVAVIVETDGGSLDQSTDARTFIVELQLDDAERILAGL